MEHKNISDVLKPKVEDYLLKNECGSSFIWGEDSVTALDDNGNPIEDFMIDVIDNEVYYTPVSNYSVTLKIK